MAWDLDKQRKAAGTYHIATNVFAVGFAVVWCILAFSMGAGIMLIFGIPFTGLCVYRLVLSLKLMNEEKATAKEPWEGGQSYSSSAAYTAPTTSHSGSYCPYCGSAVEETFAFCPKCGRKLS